MRLNSLALTPAMRLSPRFGQKWGDANDFTGSPDQFHAANGFSFDSDPSPPATTTKMVRPTDETAALALLKAVVVDPMSQAERLLFARAYRVSIGLQPDDATSLAENQRSALEQYVGQPLADRLGTLLGYWTQPKKLTVPVTYRKSGGYQE